MINWFASLPNFSAYGTPTYFIYLLLALVPLGIGLYFGKRFEWYEALISFVFIFFMFDGQVEGTIEKAGTISLPIGRLPGSAILRCIDPVHGESAITHYEPLAFCQGLTLLKIHLETGRTHQIRVHMNAIGHPLPGDYLYHPYFDVIKRQPLHSFQLSFSHPISGKSMELYAPVPEDIQKLFPSFFAETLAIKKESY